MRRSLAIACWACLALSAAAGEPAAPVRPGSVVRWSGPDIEGCGAHGQAWPPLDDVCYYAIDLLQPAGPLALERRRAGRKEIYSLEVAAFDYPVQTLTLPSGMVELSAKDLARVERENRAIARLWGRGGKRQFGLPLRPPLDPLPEGGRFGHRRVINASPRNPHSGADYTAPAGAPVLAVADGSVVMVADHFFGGQSVFLDHGDGLISMYFHLSRVDVAQGQRVRGGGTIGAVGATGRALGPHLHFGVRWHGARVNPAQLLKDPAELPAIESTSTP